MNQEVAATTRQDDLVNTARLLYMAHGVTFFFSLGTLNFVVLILNYLQRPSTEGTMVYSHHTWMIRTFWFMVLWMAVGWALFITIIGIPLAVVIWGGAWLWVAYRILRGFVDLNNGQPAAL